jgi:hypothetical protein
VKKRVTNILKCFTISAGPSTCFKNANLYTVLTPVSCLEIAFRNAGHHNMNFRRFLKYLHLYAKLILSSFLQPLSSTSSRYSSRPPFQRYATNAFEKSSCKKLGNNNIFIENQQMHQNYHFIVMSRRTLLRVSAYQHHHQGAHMILTSYLYISVHYRKNNVGAFD